jgi:hypothetical protein
MTNTDSYTKARIKNTWRLQVLKAKIFHIGRSTRCNQPISLSQCYPISPYPSISIFWFKNSAQGRINSTLVLDQEEETSQGSTRKEKQQRKRGKYTSSSLQFQCG